MWSTLSKQLHRQSLSACLSTSSWTPVNTVWSVSHYLSCSAWSACIHSSHINTFSSLSLLSVNFHIPFSALLPPPPKKKLSFVYRDFNLPILPSPKLQALVYDILPSTTAVFSYAIGSRKLSVNEQFFVGAQTVVSLLQTTQINQGVSFIAANKVYTSTNKTTIVWIEMELFSVPVVDASHVYVRALALGCFYSHISTGTLRKVLTASVDSCVEINSAPSVV